MAVLAPMPSDKRALYRLEQPGWISDDWRDSDLGRSAKFDALTPEGQEGSERDTRRIHFLEDTAKDLALALRLFAKSPGFTATAVTATRPRRSLIVTQGSQRINSHGAKQRR